MDRVLRCAYLWDQLCGVRVSEIGSIDPWGNARDRGWHVIGSPENILWQANVDRQNREFKKVFDAYFRRLDRREAVRSVMFAVVLMLVCVGLSFMFGCAHTKPAGGHRTVNRPAKYASLNPCVGKQWFRERARDAGLQP